MQSHCHQDNDILEDFCDGLVYQNHPLYSTNPNALQIMLFYDDMEVRAKTHKLGLLTDQRVVLEGGVSARRSNLAGRDINIAFLISAISVSLLRCVY
jgi:hypothetical protein